MFPMPNVWGVPELIESAKHTTQLDNGRWVPAKPLPSFALSPIRRLRIAFRVFTGRYDAVDWRSDQ